MSWFVRNPNQNRLTRFVHETTEPILKPLRRALPRLGMLDLSPIIAILLIEVARNLINSIL